MDSLFTSQVDLTCESSMVAFLRGHFRYDTMSSWNRSSSYAHCIKLHRLGIPAGLRDKAYAMLDTPVWDHLRPLISDFTARHGHQWTAGTNGRSGGYLVLYQSARVPTGYKSYCEDCGQRNYRAVTPVYDRCGVCKGLRRDFTTEPHQLDVYPGRATDMNEAFEEWSPEALRARAELVMSFDELAEEMRQELLSLLRDNDLATEEYQVTRTRTVLVPRASVAEHS